MTAADVYSGDPRAEQAGAGGGKRERARQLILRFLIGAPKMAGDLWADVTSDDITERTYERARADLAEEGVIERFQRGGQHWWRIAVPDQPPS